MPETAEQPAEETATEADVETTTEDATSETSENEDTEETFSRRYVEKLRDESAKLRIRAQHSDELAHRLHTELVRATGRLADPTDLEYSEGHLTDSESLTAALDALVESKPHLRSRKPSGDIGMGRKGAEEPVSLLGILKNFT
jgi:hypothetical protein